MTVLAVSTWHKRPDLLVEQINSYSVALDGDVVHMINVNTDFEEEFWRDAESLGIDFSKCGNVYFAERPMRTCYGGVAHAFFNGVLEAQRRNLKFDYVYWHTSSDVMIKPGAMRHIRRYDLGFKSSAGRIFHIETSEGRDRVVFPDAPESRWLRAISADPKSARTLASMGMPRLYKMRSEGSFFRRDIFFEIMYPLLANMSMHEMPSEPKDAYPIEEYLFAHCVEFFCQRNSVRRAHNLVFTSRSADKIISPDEVEQVLLSEDLFAVKRLSSDLDAPDRLLARKTLGLVDAKKKAPKRLLRAREARSEILP
ncbi:hypothetical protein ACFQXB_20225 [Plastorhodobacter daqingensis]|uniref:Glycosyltransferase family 2 protein n=1 Tax=Plastorhodobacter daqingensis TaxID=1387281 RepID=A0ABW2UPB5_9RHOB